MTTRIKKLPKEKWESVQRVKWILGIPTCHQDQRGLKAENAILEALRHWQKKKMKFLGGRQIIEINPTLHFSPEDYKGKDIIVKFQTGEVLPIQARDWWSSKAVGEFRKKGICLIVVRLFDREGKPKVLEQIKKETRESVYREISLFLELEEGLLPKEGVNFIF